MLNVRKTYLKARILKAVRNNFPGDTDTFRQNVGKANSISVVFSSVPFQFALIFTLFNFVSFDLDIDIVVDDADDDVAAVLAEPSLPDPIGAIFAAVFGTCFWYKIKMANAIR